MTNNQQHPIAPADVAAMITTAADAILADTTNTDELRQVVAHFAQHLANGGVLDGLAVTDARAVATAVAFDLTMTDDPGNRLQARARQLQAGRLGVDQAARPGGDRTHHRGRRTGNTAAGGVIIPHHRGNSPPVDNASHLW